VADSIRILVGRRFDQFAKRERLDDSRMVNAIRQIEEGLIHADLGGGLVKQRIPRSGQGGSGGYRTIIVYRSGDRAIFVHGFAKNSVANISASELAAFRKLAAELLALSDQDIQKAIDNQVFREIK
jgi:hypothetical protein